MEMRIQTVSTLIVVLVAFLSPLASAQPTVPSPDADQWTEAGVEEFKNWMTVAPEPCIGSYGRDCGLTWEFAPGAGYNVVGDGADKTTGSLSVGLNNPGWGSTLDVYFGVWSGSPSFWTVGPTWTFNLDVSIASSGTPAVTVRLVDSAREILDYDASALVPLDGSWTTLSVTLSDMTQTTGGTFDFSSVECAGIYFWYTPGDPVKLDNIYFDDGAGTTLPAVPDTWTDGIPAWNTYFRTMPEPSVSGRDYDFGTGAWDFGQAASTSVKSTGEQSVRQENPGWDRTLGDPTIMFGIYSGDPGSPWALTEDWTLNLDVIMNIGFDGIRDLLVSDASGNRLRYDLTSIVPLNPPSWSSYCGAIPEPAETSAGRDWSFPGWGFGRHALPDTVDFTAGAQSVQLDNPGWGDTIDILLGCGNDEVSVWSLTEDWNFNIDVSMATSNDPGTHPNKLVVVDINRERKEVDLNGILPLDGTWTTFSYRLGDMPTVTAGTFDASQIITAGFYIFGGTPVAKIDNVYFDNGAGTTLPDPADEWTEPAEFTTVSVRLGDMPFDTGFSTFDFSQVIQAALHYDLEVGHNVYVDNIYFDGTLDVSTWKEY